MKTQKEIQKRMDKVITEYFGVIAAIEDYQFKGISANCFSELECSKKSLIAYLNALNYCCGGYKRWDTIEG